MNQLDFKKGNWNNSDVRDFYQLNYTYHGGAEFLRGPTERTKKLYDKVERLKRLEQDFGGCLDIDTTTVSSLLTYKPGYIDQDLEIIVGLQTNRPLKRGVNPFGGIRMVEQACESYGYELSDQVRDHFKYRTTHNDGVFRVYTPEMRALRHAGVITGLPDTYEGRMSRIIDGALYGVGTHDQSLSKEQAVGPGRNLYRGEYPLSRKCTSISTSLIS